MGFMSSSQAVLIVKTQRSGDAKVTGYVNIAFPNGDEYTGDVVKGKFHGQGRYKYAKDDSTYDGSWVNNEKCGDGVFTTPTRRLDGEWAGGQMCGVGTVEYLTTGLLYAGELEEGLFHGAGALQMPDGSKYDGHFSRGKREGKGTLTYSDGSLYIGEWMCNEKHGRGRYIGVDSTFEGNWVEGQMSGKGILKHDSGDSYEGEWSQGHFSGKGLFKYRNGDSYEGEFRNGMRCGYGVLRFANNEVFQGYWNNDLMHGHGVHVKGQLRKEGRWEDGQYCNEKSEVAFRKTELRGIRKRSPSNASSFLISAKSVRIADPISTARFSVYQTHQDNDVKIDGREGFFLRYLDKDVEGDFRKEFYGKFQRYQVGFAMSAVVFAVVAIQAIIGGNYTVCGLWWAAFSVCVGVLGIVTLLPLNPSKGSRVHWLMLFTSASVGGLSAAAHLISADARTHPMAISLVILGVLTVIRPISLHAVQYVTIILLEYIILYRVFPVKDWYSREIAARILEVAIVCSAPLISLQNAERHVRRLYYQTRMLVLENIKYEREFEKCKVALASIFPYPVAEILQEERGSLRRFSQFYEEGSVILANVVTFAQIIATLPPASVIYLVNTIFKKFDAHCSRLRVEKIKSLGDSYMAATGIPSPDRYHCERAAEFGLAMLSSIEAIKRELRGLDYLNIRVGIGSGSTTAGIVGTIKLSYEIFGEAVEDAEVMESSADPQTIRISEDCFYSLNEAYDIEAVTDQEGTAKYLLKGRLQDNVPEYLLRPIPKFEYSLHVLEKVEGEEYVATLDEGLLTPVGKYNRFLLRFENKKIEEDFDQVRYDTGRARILGAYLVGSIISILIPTITMLVYTNYENNSPITLVGWIPAFLQIPLFANAVLQEKKLFCYSWRKQITDLNSVAPTRVPFSWSIHFSIVIIIAFFLVSIIQVSLVNHFSAGTVTAFAMVGILTYAYSFDHFWFLYKLIAGFACIVLIIGVLLNSSGGSRQSIEDAFSIIVIFILTLLSTYFMEDGLRLAYTAQRLVAQTMVKAQNENRFTEQAMLSVLPRVILNQLSDNPNDDFVHITENASVMFAEIEGLHLNRGGDDFESYETIRKFNLVLDSIDTLCTLHGIEKIKSHPFFAVSGCPEPREDHASALLKFAIALQKSVKFHMVHNNLRIKFRIGICSGNIFGGVVGAKRFAFDVYGEPVAIASRLAAVCELGRVHISESAVEQFRLKPMTDEGTTIKFTPTQPIVVEGGEVHAYYAHWTSV